MANLPRLPSLQTHLLKEIKAAHEAVKRPLSAEDITSIVQLVIQSLEGDDYGMDAKFYSELEDLARYIRNAKLDIASIKPHDINTDHIPQATDELDAVVGATEEATNKIMDVCDELTALAGGCSPEINEKLIGCTTKIFEACNFQDITGQRITKVVKTLKHIDAKVEALVKALGTEVQFEENKSGVIRKSAPGSDEELLNGPQLPRNAANQDDIDRLLSEK